MSKRILVHGSMAKVITCSCGCKYEYEVSDVEENNVVICPECGKENTAPVK